MITVLDCIKRVPSIMEKIIDGRKENTKALFDFLGDKAKDINEIVMIGSGTSSTCCMTSKGFVERVTKIKTSVCVPNEFLYDKTAFNKNALYIFTSQSGNSILTWECLKRMKAAGYMTVATTEGPETPMALDAGVHVDMCCGYEEYGFRTIGYCASILTHMVIAIELGLKNGTISQSEYDAHIADAKKVPASHKEICDKTMAWYDKNEAKITSANCYFLYGAACLWGVALEGALKVLEMSGDIAIGYELEEGLHGPTMAFSDKTCIIALHDGTIDSEKSIGLGKMAKKEFGLGFVVGCDAIDETDLSFTPVGGEFRSIEFAPTVEILAYRLALSKGIDLAAPIVMKDQGYYAIHDEDMDKVMKIQMERRGQ